MLIGPPNIITWVIPYNHNKITSVPTHSVRHVTLFANLTTVDFAMFGTVQALGVNINGDGSVLLDEYPNKGCIQS